jgi:hypothetical protein
MARRGAVLQFYSVKGGLLMGEKGCVTNFLNVPFTFVIHTYLAKLSNRRFSSSSESDIKVDCSEKKA